MMRRTLELGYFLIKTYALAVKSSEVT